MNYEELKSKALMLEAENEALKRDIELLKQAYTDNDKQWQNDYTKLLAKYELTAENILEKK